MRLNNKGFLDLRGLEPLWWFMCFLIVIGLLATIGGCGYGIHWIATHKIQVIAK